jgi:DNA-binding CsgD family transcriptional regulator
VRKPAVIAEGLLKVEARLGEAVIDPTIWPELLHQISAAVGATGAVLLQSDVRTSDIPRSAGADELIRSYFANGWHTRDVRAERGVPLLLRGEKVHIDQDIVTPEDMRKLELYTENLAPLGFQWFAAIGFWSESALWALSIQRTTKEGPFEQHDKRVLARLSPRLTETATLSKSVGRAALVGVTNALQLIRQPALAVDRFGFVVQANSALEKLFDNEIRIRERRLFVSDKRAGSALELFIDELRIKSDTAELSVAPIVVQRTDKRPIVIRILPIAGAARTPFLGARALLTFSDLCRAPRPQADLLSQMFGLSRAEANLAAVIAAGISPEQAAEELGIARETARTQLKAIYAKTDTHRQGELIALLSRLL